MFARFLRTIACAAALTGAFASVAAAGDDWIERLGAEALARHLNLDANTVFNSRRGTIFDDAPAFAIHRHTNRDVNDVWRLRQQGLGWGQIAQRLGMHPGTFNKMRNNGEFDNDRIWSRALDSRFDLSDSELSRLRGSGMGWRDCFAAAHTARSRRDKLDNVIGEWRHSKNWSQIRERHSNRRDDSSHGKSKGKSKSKGKGRGKGGG